MSALDFDARRAGLPPITVCPACQGQLLGQECDGCRSAGYVLTADGEPMIHAQIVQIAAVMAMAASMNLVPATPEVLEARAARPRCICPAGSYVVGDLHEPYCPAALA